MLPRLILIVLCFSLSRADDQSQPTVRDEILARAKQNFMARRFAEVEAELTKIVGAEASDTRARYLLIRSLLMSKQPEKALATAEEGVRAAPEDGYSLLGLGDAQFRVGEYDKAASSYFRARSVQPDLARAYLGLAEILISVGKRQSAKGNLRKAYELDPNDPDVMMAWARALPASPEELELWEKASEEATHLDPVDAQGIRAFVELRQRKPGVKLAVLKEAPPTLQIPLKRQGPPGAADPEFSIEIQINGGKKRRMVLDTGASGILMTAKDAEKDQVEVIAGTKLGGVGDEGSRSGFLGFADAVKIGAVTLANCPIKLAEKKIWHSGADGLIGTNVFHDFLITIDCSRFSLSLERLPDQPDSYCCDSANEGQDDFTRIHLLGSHIVAPGRINDRQNGLFLIDTGAQESMVDDDVAAAVTTTGSTRMQAYGISGRVKDLREAREIVLLFGGIRQQHGRMLSLDLADLSHRLGCEVKVLVGRTLLKHVALTIDYRNALIKLMPIEQ